MMTVLHTTRIILRSWNDNDHAPFAELNADPRVMEHFPSVLTRHDSNLLVDRLAAGIEARGWGFWAAELRDGGHFIGFVGLSPVSFTAHFTPATEIGWRLAHPYWGQGLAPEAAEAALAFAFDELGLAEVVSFTVGDNIRSQRVVDKIGMSYRPDDDFDHPLLPPEHRLFRHVLYRLTREDWQTRSVQDDLGSTM
jgi:RimJ/RimL family protein N-acetyltransferase